MVYHNRRRIFDAVKHGYGLVYLDEEDDAPRMNEDTTLSDLGIDKADGSYAVTCIDHIAKDLEIKDVNGLVKKLQQAELETVRDVIDVIKEF